MAKTKTKGPSKSKSIRDYMRKNKGATVPQIVNGLKADGVVVTPGLVYQAKAAVKKKRGTKKMAKRMSGSSNGSTRTKADLIREVAGGMEKPVRPKDVVAALKERGVDVLHTHVSQVLASMGMKRKRRKVAAGVSAPAVASNGLNIDDLVPGEEVGRPGWLSRKSKGSAGGAGEVELTVNHARPARRNSSRARQGRLRWIEGVRAVWCAEDEEVKLYGDDAQLLKTLTVADEMQRAA